MTRVVRDSAGLLVGTLVNGVFAYVFFAQATRGLGAASAAPVAVLWTYWGVTTAVITFPVQHWIIRTMRASGQEAVRAALPRMAAAVLGVSAGATLLAWLGDDQLFTRPGFVFPLLVGLVTVGSFFTGVVRGGLSGRERFGATAVALAADNVVRVLLAFFVLRAGGGPVAIGVVLVVAAAIGLAWPSGYRFAAGSTTDDARSSLTFVGAVAASSLLGQVVLVGGPAVLAFLGGAPREVTMLFTTLALFRAPYLLGVGVANRMTGSLTGWVGAGDQRRVHAFQLLVAGATVLGSGVGALAAAEIGPALVGLVFGADTIPPALVAAVVAVGSAFAVGNLALSLLAIAQVRGNRLTRAWVVGAVVAAVLLVATPAEPLVSVAWAFLAGEVSAFAFLLWSGWRLPVVAPAGTDPLGAQPSPPGAVA